MFFGEFHVFSVQFFNKNYYISLLGNFRPFSLGEISNMLERIVYDCERI